MEKFVLHSLKFFNQNSSQVQSWIKISCKDLTTLKKTKHWLFIIKISTFSQSQQRVFPFLCRRLKAIDCQDFPRPDEPEACFEIDRFDVAIFQLEINIADWKINSIALDEASQRDSCWKWKLNDKLLRQMMSLLMSLKCSIT